MPVNLSINISFLFHNSPIFNFIQKLESIKYSYKPGEIIIGLYEKDSKAIVVFRNKGEHLIKEKTDKLFDRFYRVDESRNTSTGGSGLGLAISKNIVELHDGKIWAESIGNNISFYVELDIFEMN